MNINQHLDTTYLKTVEQANISERQTLLNIKQLVEEAIINGFKLVMIRPKFVSLVKRMIFENNSKVLVGTVIGFHDGILSIESKLKEAKNAIYHGVDELDFVINYKEFINGNIDLVIDEIVKGTELALNNDKVVKWIIEIAALTTVQIIEITKLIKDVVIENFGKENAKYVFVKSSTGFYKTKNSKPNGATFDAMQLIVKHAIPLQVKAAGGIKSYDDAIKMINLGVSRIGTSSAKIIADGGKSNKNY